MQQYKISEVRKFMAGLFQGDLFDSFLLSEATITTFVTYQIDGSFHKDYFDSEDPHIEQASDLASWKLLKEPVFQLIRGSQSPLRMQIVLKLAERNVDKLLRQSGLSLNTSDIAGLFVNIRYYEKELSVTTGSALTIFTLDRTLDHTWDEMIEKLLHAKGIPFQHA